MLDKVAVHKNGPLIFSALKKDYENTFDDFETFWYTKEMDILRTGGLLVF